MSEYVPLPDPSKPFESEEERAAAFASPRYASSPEYRDNVAARLSVTEFGAPPTNRISTGAIRMDAGGEPTSHPSLRLNMTGEDVENAQKAAALRAEIANVKAQLAADDSARIARGELPNVPSDRPYPHEHSEEIVSDISNPLYRAATPEGAAFRAHVAGRLAVTK